MIVRFGSARMTASSTSSSTTTITRSAANAASFWQPSRPQTWVLPAARALGVDDRHVRLERRHGVDHASPYGDSISRISGLASGQVGLEIAAQREERQIRGARRVAADHPEVAVLLELERLVRRPAALDPPADRARPPTPGLPSHEKIELAGDARRDHLVVDQVRRHARERQVALVRWRMISWPAAKPMRWVKPSIATVSPSRTTSAIASCIVATLEVRMAEDVAGSAGGAEALSHEAARALAGSRPADVGQPVRGHVVDRLARRCAARSRPPPR